MLWAFLVGYGSLVFADTITSRPTFLVCDGHPHYGADGAAASAAGAVVSAAGAGAAASAAGAAESAAGGAAVSAAGVGAAASAAGAAASAAGAAALLSAAVSSALPEPLSASSLLASDFDAAPSSQKMPMVEHHQDSLFLSSATAGVTAPAVNSSAAAAATRICLIM